MFDKCPSKIPQLEQSGLNSVNLNELLHLSMLSSSVMIRRTDIEMFTCYLQGIFCLCTKSDPVGSQILLYSSSASAA